MLQLVACWIIREFLACKCDRAPHMALEPSVSNPAPMQLQWFATSGMNNEHHEKSRSNILHSSASPGSSSPHFLLDYFKFFLKPSLKNAMKYFSYTSIMFWQSIEYGEGRTKKYYPVITPRSIVLEPIYHFTQRVLDQPLLLHHTCLQHITASCRLVFILWTLWFFVTLGMRLT